MVIYSAMRYLTFTLPDDPHHLRWGVLVGESAVELLQARTWAQGARGLPPEDLPDSLLAFMYAGEHTRSYVRQLVEAMNGENPAHLKAANRKPVGYSLDQVQLYPPLPRLNTLRDFYAFEEHVKAAFANRDRTVPAEWYQFPVFYFSNPNAIFGPDEAIPYPDYTQALDYELEVACVIGSPGIDIPPEKAEQYIFGYTIFNDWSARDVQRAEMRVGLGPAKGKDFAASMGPWIVTPEELTDHATDRPGVYDLAMVARLNGQERSRGNWRDLHYSFGEMIARASAGVYLLPGDVIGSGTVGTGCLLELTQDQGPWLQPGDVVELEIERLGVLRNGISRRS